MIHTPKQYSNPVRARTRPERLSTIQWYLSGYNYGITPESQHHKDEMIYSIRYEMGKQAYRMGEKLGRAEREHAEMHALIMGEQIRILNGYLGQKVLLQNTLIKKAIPSRPHPALISLEEMLDEKNMLVMWGSYDPSKAAFVMVPHDKDLLQYSALRILSTKHYGTTPDDGRKQYYVGRTYKVWGKEIEQIYSRNSLLYPTRVDAERRYLGLINLPDHIKQSYYVEGDIP